MTFESLAEKMGMNHRKISENVAYLESPLVIPEDGAHIGAYLSRNIGDKIRISDDSNILFHALTHGVKPNAGRGKLLQQIAEQCGVSLSEDGEVYAECHQSELQFYLARFLEAADRIAFAAHGFRPVPSSAFEIVLAKVLGSAFPDRVQRHFRVHGASGHQLIFPFVIDAGSTKPRFLQLVPALDGKANWSSVYQVLGKMTDLKNNHAVRSKRLVVLEPIPARDVAQATTALADAAEVLVYNGPEDFLTRLAA